MPTCFTWLEKSVFLVTKNVDVTAYDYIYKISYYILLYTYIVILYHILYLLYIFYFLFYIELYYIHIYREKTLYIHRLKRGSLAFQS